MTRKHRRDAAGCSWPRARTCWPRRCATARLPETVVLDRGALAPGGPLLRCPPEVELVAATAEALASAGSLGSGSRVIGVWRQRWAEPPSRGARRPRSTCTTWPIPATSARSCAPRTRSAPAAVRAERADGRPVRRPRPCGPAWARCSAVPVARATCDEARARSAGLAAVALVPGAGTPLRELGAAGPALFVLGRRAGRAARRDRRRPATRSPTCRSAGRRRVAQRRDDRDPLPVRERAIHRLSPDRWLSRRPRPRQALERLEQPRRGGRAGGAGGDDARAGRGAARALSRAARPS